MDLNVLGLVLPFAISIWWVASPKSVRAFLNRLYPDRSYSSWMCRDRSMRAVGVAMLLFLISMLILNVIPPTK